MADSVPMISVSAEAEDENFSLSDSEEANRAKTMIASRMRRRQKQKKKSATPAKPSAGSLIVDDGDESGLTDVETVEVDGNLSSAEQSKSSSPAEDFTPIFDATLQPQIVQIIDDHEGKTHVKTIVKGVVAALDDSDLSDADDEGDGPRLTLMEALTDVESLDDSLEESDGRSDSSEMNRLIGQLDFGESVNTHNAEEENLHRPPPQYQAKGSSSMLLCPKTAAGRKKPRKSRSKKKAAAGASAGGALLSVTTPDDGPLTDVESISGVEDDEQASAVAGASAPAGSTLMVDDAQDEGTTDIEDFPFSDDDDVPLHNRLAPGILVTVENSETESSYDNSGRSSRLGLTDVESVYGVNDDENSVPPPLTGLGVPQNTDDPTTDVEEIDNVEDEETPLVAPSIPRNGPALNVGQQHVVTIQEDEHGRVTSRKFAGSPGLLGFNDTTQEEGGTTDVEYVGTSADEDDSQSRGVTPEIEMFAGSTVRVKRHSLTIDPQLDQPSDASDNEVPAAANYSLMPPVQAVDALTDTEDMEMSDGETGGNQEAEDQAASAACQQYDPTCSAISESEPSLPSQPDWSDSAQGGM